MRISVEREDKWLDVVVSRAKTQSPLTPVWLTWLDEHRKLQRELLCQVVRSGCSGGWTVVVAGHPNDVVGLRSVEGFATCRQALMYAVSVRYDLNRKHKDAEQRGYSKAMIAGKCPACGKGTLSVGHDTHITCFMPGCPRPTAVDELLNMLGPDHIVHLGAKTFAVEHPIVERLEHRILACELDGWLKTHNDAPFEEPGWYRVPWTGDPENCVWERIPDPTGAQ